MSHLKLVPTEEKRAEEKAILEDLDKTSEEAAMNYIKILHDAIDKHKENMTDSHKIQVFRSGAFLPFALAMTASFKDDARARLDAPGIFAQILPELMNLCELIESFNKAPRG